MPQSTGSNSGPRLPTWLPHVAVTNEFWQLGDREAQLGVPISPLCDRNVDSNIAKSQIGFFQFMCNPFYEQVADLLDPDCPPILQLAKNFKEWKQRASKQAEAAAEAAATEQMSS